MEDNEKKYSCKKCNFECDFNSQWLKHIETELHKTGFKKKRSDIKESYKCDKCLYETKNATIFKQHKLTEHKTKEEREKQCKYYCKYCDMGTFSKNVFENHNKSNKHIKYVGKQNDNV
jgi:hypothetical protein